MSRIYCLKSIAKCGPSSCSMNDRSRGSHRSIALTPGNGQLTSRSAVHRLRPLVSERPHVRKDRHGRRSGNRRRHVRRGVHVEPQRGGRIKVTCLEQGGWPIPSRYPSTHEDWELHISSDYHFDPNVRGLPEDYPVNTDDSAIVPFMYNAVGGSAIHWGAHFPRMRPSDFPRSRRSTTWPMTGRLTYYDLEPYFDLNDQNDGRCRPCGESRVSSHAAASDASARHRQAGQ